MPDIPDSVWLALISAAGGGTGLEVVKRIWSRRDREMDEATAIRLEQRQEIKELHERLDEQDARCNARLEALEVRLTHSEAQQRATTWQLDRLRLAYERDTGRPWSGSPGGEDT